MDVVLLDMPKIRNNAFLMKKYIEATLLVQGTVSITEVEVAFKMTDTAIRKVFNDLLTCSQDISKAKEGNRVTLKVSQNYKPVNLRQNPEQFLEAFDYCKAEVTFEID
ncbi:hypothetical protein [Vibrio crassostreae]|uniref:hypothetical protein n=1 Tax=Vibrio crassostreae TaxID=246167 RepID=UPI001B30397B|nr:hypothetical protein [Vibrio crassostreae]